MDGVSFRRADTIVHLGSQSTWTERITIIQHRMIIGVITAGMIIGYLVGMYIVDRYINTNHEDIDKN